MTELIPMFESSTLCRSLYHVACRFAEQGHRAEFLLEEFNPLPWAWGGNKASCESVGTFSTPGEVSSGLTGHSSYCLEAMMLEHGATRRS